MRSMTGFGQGVANVGNNQVEIEISAVNCRKQTEVRTTIPRELLFLEQIIKKQVLKTISRGNLTISFKYSLDSEYRKGQVSIDTELAAFLINNLKSVAKKANISADIRIADILELPGVVSEKSSLPKDLLKDLTIKSLKDGLKTLQIMQSKEGELIKDDLMVRYTNMVDILNNINKKTEQVMTHYHSKLLERIRLFGVELELNDERLAKELAFYADRSDINEEVVRLDSHLKQLDSLLKLETPGRELLFLGQEMGREITTLCSKTCDTEVNKLSLSFKNELNRLKEQILNVE